MNLRALTLFALTASAALPLLPSVAAAQTPVCVPGNPFYDHGDYRCFGHRPVPTHARATVAARVEAARFLSGGALTAEQREALEDHFSEVGASLGAELPSLVDGNGALHTPDVRVSVVVLPSGEIGRVRVLSRHADPLDRQIASAIASGVSSGGGLSVESAEVEVIVRFHPRLHYTRYRPRVVPCCVDDDE